jgi:hypothetical protein
MNHLLNTLAVWRVTRMLIHEAGPGDIFSRLRDIIGVEFDIKGNPNPLNVFATGFMCFKCLSVWVGLVFGFGRIRDALAYSAGAIIIHVLVERR